MVKNKNDIKTRVGCFLVLLIIVLVIINVSNKSTVTKTDAAAMARVYVKEHLTAPSTADFPWNMDVTQVGDEWEVNSYVDAQNAFGAKVRNKFTCKLKTTDKGKTWQCLELNINGEYY